MSPRGCMLLCSAACFDQQAAIEVALKGLPPPHNTEYVVPFDDEEKADDEDSILV